MLGRKPDICRQYAVREAGAGLIEGMYDISAGVQTTLMYNFVY